MTGHSSIMVNNMGLVFSQSGGGEFEEGKTTIQWQFNQHKRKGLGGIQGAQISSSKKRLGLCRCMDSQKTHGGGETYTNS